MYDEILSMIEQVEVLRNYEEQRREESDQAIIRLDDFEDFLRRELETINDDAIASRKLHSLTDRMTHMPDYMEERE